ncbi:Hemolysin secretion protein D, chromosomal [Salinivirga cyanobacteriivorans]|uniref:Hemolysin secretion protein D, chromosomal n=1 Tax=Salinivirga cyanobacteriivorans TaxID=1307839 RepID=A0A0S2HW21_9BACT|nr:HlyD family efflux transporter periplasmic adaptor subunit [Salinivirga cyanobacteriivorans]ALO14140.1 Hemolysin secretion protein D, chromosomal [Salinivirga cyanobacteriivorans]
MPEKTENKPKIELRSEEVQEILGHIPSWIVRWGITMFFFILAALLIGSHFFAYPDVVNGEVEILSVNPPVEIRSKVNGHIDTLYFKDNQHVDKSQIIGTIKNPAKYEDVVRAEQYLDSLKQHIQNNSFNKITIPAKIPSLGNMQSFWASLVSSLNAYQEFYTDKYYDKKIANLKAKIKQQKGYLETLSRQIQLVRQSLSLTKSRYGKDSMLYARKVIAEAEFDQSKQNLIQHMQSLESQEAALTQAQMQLTSQLDQLTDYANQNKRETDQLLREIRQNMENLASSISVWEDNYLIKASKSGKVSFTGIWSSKQPVQAGDIICTIVPEQPGEIMGRVKLSTQGAGKVEKNQKVNIKLMDYPYMEFGMIQGKVENVALVPNEEFYWAYVDIPKPLKTTYGKQISFRQKMPGTAEIVTKDLSVLDRFLQPIMHALHSR